VASADRDANVRRDQVPLALLMVGLTTLTLWSLGQTVISTETEEAATTGRAAAVAATTTGPGVSSRTR
jgi:hypothetical protein